MNHRYKTCLSHHSRLVIAGFISTCAYVYLMSSSQNYGDTSLVQLYSVAGVCAALSVYLWWSYHSRGQQVPVTGLLLFAIAFRAVGVLAFPVLEDDVFRYLWDGRMSMELGSPYGLAPSDYFDSTDIGERFEEILGLINYPDIATIYGPTNQWVFALSYLIAPGETWPLQVIYALADIALIGVLLKLAKPNMVMLYAWSPLIIKEFAFTAHPDVLGALFLMTAFLAYQRGYFIRTGALLALAVGVKLFAILIVPLLLGLQWRAWFVFVLSALVISLPWGVLDAWIPTGLVAMSNEWLFNAPIYLAMQSVLPFSVVKLTLLSLLAIGCIWYWGICMKHWPRKVVRGDILFAALFLCVPVVNAWYLVWLLPFAVIYPSLWPWAASVTVLLAYASGINLPNSELGAYELAPSMVAIEYFLVVLAAIVQRWLSHSRFKTTQ